MCQYHWSLVPYPMRQGIILMYRNGAAYTQAHRNAVIDAQLYVIEHENIHMEGKEIINAHRGKDNPGRDK